MAAEPFGGALDDREGSAVARLSARLHEHDWVVGNLEVALTGRGRPSPKPTRLRGSPAVARDLRALGIDAVGLANNHVFDFGADGMFETMDACASAGIETCGAGRTVEEALRPARRTRRGQELALLSVSCTLPNACEASIDAAGIAPIRVECALEMEPDLAREQPGMAPVVRTRFREADADAVSRSITALKAEGAFVIVAIHWGVQPNHLACCHGLLAEYQRPLGHRLIDAGADVIYGTHPHVLHPIEIYRGRPVLFSLGNFLFTFGGPLLGRESVIATVRLEPLELELTPLVIGADGLPALARGEAAVRILTALAQVSEPLGTRLTIAAERARVECVTPARRHELVETMFN